MIQMKVKSPRARPSKPRASLARRDPELSPPPARRRLLPPTSSPRRMRSRLPRSTRKLSPATTLMIQAMMPKRRNPLLRPQLARLPLRAKRLAAPAMKMIPQKKRSSSSLKARLPRKPLQPRERKLRALMRTTPMTQMIPMPRKSQLPRNPYPTVGQGSKARSRLLQATMRSPAKKRHLRGPQEDSQTFPRERRERPRLWRVRKRTGVRKVRRS